jgi:hypothetical protein
MNLSRRNISRSGQSIPNISVFEVLLPKQL